MIPIYCEVCEAQFAQADHEELKTPMKGAMFISNMAKNGVPAPFHPNAEWQYMRCPYCNFRPFTFEDRVLIFPPSRKFYVFGEPLDKPDSEKTLYDRNQETINKFIENFDSQNDFVNNSDEEGLKLTCFQCRHCGKPYKTLIRMMKHEADCSHGK